MSQHKSRSIMFEEIIADKEFVDAVYEAMKPALDAVVYRAAMVAKQMALQMKETKKPNNRKATQ